MTIKELIRKIVDPMIKPTLYVGTVKKFNSTDWTIDVELNRGATIEEVRIKSIIGDEASGIFIEPVINSKVLIATIEDKIEDCVLISVDAIKKFKLNATELIEFNSSDFGGIVKIKELEENLNSLKSFVEAMKLATSTGLNAVGVGPAANGATAKAAFDSAMIGRKVQFKEMENKKVKHG
jgi:hypothetical protein